MRLPFLTSDRRPEKFRSATQGRKYARTDVKIR